MLHFLRKWQEKSKLLFEFDDDNLNIPEGGSDDHAVIEDGEPKAKKRKKKKQKPSSFTAKWSKPNEVTFSRQPVDIEEEKITALYQKLGLCFVLFILEFTVLL